MQSPERFLDIDTGKEHITGTYDGHVHRPSRQARCQEPQFQRADSSGTTSSSSWKANAAEGADHRAWVALLPRVAVVRPCDDVPSRMLLRSCDSTLVGRRVTDFERA